MGLSFPPTLFPPTPGGRARSFRAGAALQGALAALIAVRCGPLAADPVAGSVRDLVRAANEWVVAIDVERTKDLPRSPFEPRRISPQGKTAFQRPQGPVTGILLDAEGHILTTHYNVGGDVKSIQVHLPGGAVAPARLLGSSPADDVALLRLEQPLAPPLPSFPVLPGADEPELHRPGRIVFVLGRSPDPASVTVTRGIVSASHRNGGRAVQTDAELNYGNAGGPLLGLDGRLLGMAAFVGHTQPQWGQNSGVGFAVKSQALLDLLPRLKAGERVQPFRPGYLGVQCERTSRGGLGAEVIQVISGGGAARAGVLKGDLILLVDGIEILDFDHLRRTLFKRSPGERVKLKLRRGEEPLELEVELGDLPR